MPAAHRAASADAGGLEVEGIVVVEMVGGEGEADDVAALNGDDAAAWAALFVEGEFECGIDVERVELAAGGVEEGFGVGEFLNRHTARVERGRGRERARRGDAEADGVAGDVEACAGEGEDVAVVVGRDAEAQGRAACGERDDALSPRNAVQEFQPQPRCAVECGQATADRRVERVAVIGGELASLHGEVDGDMGRRCVRVSDICEGVWLWHLDSP